MVAITCNFSNQRVILVILERAVYTESTPAESHWTSSYRHTLDWFASLVNCYSVFGRNVYFECWSIPYTWQLYSEQATCMACHLAGSELPKKTSFPFQQTPLLQKKTQRLLSVNFDQDFGPQTNTLNSFFLQQINRFDRLHLLWHDAQLPVRKR